MLGPQEVNFIEVSGAGTCHGGPHNISTYAVRLPVVGPVVEVFVCASLPRRVGVWVYLVA